MWKLKDRTNAGRVKDRPPKRLDTPVKNGYLAVSFWYQGKPYMISAHRAVYTVLSGKIPEGLDVNHKDGNKHNNAPENLEVLRRGDNHRHAYRLGLKVKAGKAKELAAEANRLRTEQGLSYRQIGEALGVCTATAYNSVRLARS